MALKPSAPVDELSIDVDAELASVAPETPAQETPTEETDSSSDFFDSEEDASAEDEGEESSDEDTESEDDDYFIEVPANGKTHRIDLRNRDEVRKHLSAGLGVKQAFSELAKYRQENKRLVQEMKASQTFREKAELMDKLEKIKDDETELYRVITGGKSLDDIVEARVKKKLAWADASPEERERMERDEREAALMARIERMEAMARNEREEAARLSEVAEEKKAYSIAHPEYTAILKELAIKDPTERQETATDLWELGWARIGRLVAQNEKERELDPSLPPLELTPHLVRKQFQAVAARWGYTAKAKAKEQVSQIIDKKSKVATKRAGLAATKNYSKSSLASDLQNLSPTKAFEKLFKK
jgi:hypothetical protein